MLDAYLNLIRKRCWSWHRSTGIDYADLFDVGLEAAQKAERKWDPEKRAFSTFLWITLENTIKNYVQRRMLERELFSGDELEASQVPNHHGQLNPEISSDFKDRMAHLSQEASEVARVVLESPLEILGMVAPESPKAIRSRLKNFFLKRGWTEKKVTLAFQEIKEMVR